MKMIELTQGKKMQIDKMVAEIGFGNTITFGDISKSIWGHPYGAGRVGGYIANQRDLKDYPYWRVTNADNHPVADLKAISELQKEGHQIINGKIS